MSILVTGGGGFIGSHLVEYLRTQCLDVTAVGLHSREGVYGCDLQDLAATRRMVRELKPKIVYHFAGISKVSADITTEEYFRKNTLSTIYLLQALEELGGPLHFFFASTVHLYGSVKERATEEFELKPESPYAFSKFLAEESMREAVSRWPSLTALSARLYTCLGPGQPSGFAASDLVRKVVEGKRTASPVLKTGPLNAYRRFLDVRDAVKLFPLVLEKSPIGLSALNIASLHKLQISELLDIFLKEAHYSPQIESAPSSNNLFTGLDLDLAKLDKLVGTFPFRPIQNSLRDMLRWQEEHGKESRHGH